MTRPQPWDPIEAPPVHRGTARYEVREAIVPNHKGHPVAVQPLRGDAEAMRILARERISRDEWRVTFLLFWRTDADPS